MLQNLQNFAIIQKLQLDNLVDFETCCKTRIFLQKSVPIQPKTSNILPKFYRSAVVWPTGRYRATPWWPRGPATRSPASAPSRSVVRSQYTDADAGEEKKNSKSWRAIPFFARFDNFLKQIRAFVELPGNSRKSDKILWISRRK